MCWGRGKVAWTPQPVCGNPDETLKGMNGLNWRIGCAGGEEKPLGIVMLKIVVYLLEILLMLKGIQSGAHSLIIKVIELLTKSIHLQMMIFIDSHTLLSK